MLNWNDSLDFNFHQYPQNSNMDECPAICKNSTYLSAGGKFAMHSRIDEDTHLKASYLALEFSKHKRTSEKDLPRSIYPANIKSRDDSRSENAKVHNSTLTSQKWMGYWKWGWNWLASLSIANEERVGRVAHRLEWKLEERLLRSKVICGRFGSDQCFGWNKFWNHLYVGNAQIEIPNQRHGVDVEGRMKLLSELFKYDSNRNSISFPSFSFALKSRNRLLWNVTVKVLGASEIKWKSEQKRRTVTIVV